MVLQAIVGYEAEIECRKPTLVNVTAWAAEKGMHHFLGGSRPIQGRIGGTAEAPGDARSLQSVSH